MTEEKLCGGKTFKEVMEEVNFHIFDKHKIEQLQKENAKLKTELFQKSDTNHSLVEQLTDKEIIISELKAQISVLLSCKDCPENKGGYICEKEYNDKCLAQKIEYIKELKEENEELNRDKTELEKENIELIKQVEDLKFENTYYHEFAASQAVTIIKLEEKLKKVSEWVKEQEYPDGCIDCESWDTDKLKEILK